MLLAVNIENSRIFCGVFDTEGNIVLKFKISTDLKKTSDEYESLFYTITNRYGIEASSIDDVMISSVVPQLTGEICDALIKFASVSPSIIGPGIKTGFPIKIDNPSELGGDIVANIAACINIQKEKQRKNLSSVIVDMNTVTTVSAVNQRGEFVGCAILPGIQLSLDSMHIKTAQLPNVSVISSNRFIGKNSQDAVRSGVIFGNSMAIDGFAKRFANELRIPLDELNLVITGEYAKYVLDFCKLKFTYVEDLTIKGIYCIYRNNKK